MCSWAEPDYRVGGLGGHYVDENGWGKGDLRSSDPQGPAGGGRGYVLPATGRNFVDAAEDLADRGHERLNGDWLQGVMELGGRVQDYASGEGRSFGHSHQCCPEVDEQLGLELIREAEATKLRRREAEIAVNKLVETCKLEPALDWELGDKAVKDLQCGVGVSWAWLRRLFPGAPSWLVSAVPVVASMDESPGA